MENLPNRVFCIVAPLMMLPAAGAPALAQDIFAAAEAGDVARITEILASQPDLVNARNEEGQAPLHLAAGSGHLEVVELLLDHGASPEETDARGFTAADIAFQREVQRGQSEITRYLVQHGAPLDPNSPVMGGIGKLDFAVATANIGMARLLIELDVDVNARTAYPLSPLFNASYRGMTELVELLLDAGADVNAPSYREMTPIVGAIVRGHTDVVGLLIDHGADLGFVDETTGRNLLELAVLSGNLDVVDRLIARGLPLDDTDNDGRTALYYAARYGHQGVYDRLEASGAVATDDIETRFGKSPYLTGDLSDGQAVAWYLNHRGWAIETSDHFLVFDAEEFGVTRPTDPALANGFLTPAEIADQDVLALYTCYHGEIGEPAYIHEIEDSLASIRYVHQAADPWRGSDATVYLSPHDTISLDDVEIVTVQVTEEMPSLGYLLKVDGLFIYYAGFRVEVGAKFQDEIDFLTEHTGRVDLAFLQWVGPDEDDNEVRQFVERFDPRAVLILSPDRQEDRFPEMVDRLRAWGFQGEVFAAALPGDEFVYGGR